MASGKKSPWGMKSINEFQYFNCPKCEFKDQSKQEFINHANELHLESIEYLEQMEDLDGVVCPWKSDDDLDKTKSENVDKRTLSKIKKRNLKQFHYPCEFCDFNCLTLKGLLKHNEGAHEGFHEMITKIHEENYSKEDIFDFASIALIPMLPVSKYGDDDQNGDEISGTNQNITDQSTEDLDPIQDDPWADDADDDDDNDIANKSRSENVEAIKMEKKDPEEMKENILPKVTPKFRNILPKLPPNEVLKRYECGQCEKKFVSKKWLQKHLETFHVSEAELEWFMCDKCPVKFSGTRGESKLRAHHKIHEPKTHKCEQCSMMFTWNRGLKRHIERVHEGIRPVANMQCDQCKSSGNELGSGSSPGTQYHSFTYIFN